MPRKIEITLPDSISNEEEQKMRLMFDEVHKAYRHKRLRVVKIDKGELVAVTRFSEKSDSEDEQATYRLINAHAR